MSGFLMIGWKVQVVDRRAAGFGEIDHYSPDRCTASVRYYVDPTKYTLVDVAVANLDRHTTVPTQSRCVVDRDGTIRVGRVLAGIDGNPSQYRSYWIQLPNQQPMQVREDDFHVLTYASQCDPVTILAQRGHETPFFAEQRWPLKKVLTDQCSLCQGLTGIAASRIELFPHQVEVARRVLLDPVLRYLLADEVGLGKTIEAGMILKQLSLDQEDLEAVVFCPSVLVPQWMEELEQKFGLADVQVFAHESIATFSGFSPDIVVIDEVHRLITNVEGDENAAPLYSVLQKLSSRVPRLLLLSATPVLYRDTDLLALLHILDPENYSLSDLPAFRRLLALRQNMGRSILALERTTLSAMLRSQVARIADLLPNDTTVQQIAAEVPVQFREGKSDTAKELVRRLRSHLGETYCIHRRMLRTRRSYLEEDLGIGARRVEQGVEYELNDTWRQTTWELVEEWRIQAATQGDSAERNCWIDAYFKLCSAIAASPTQACEIIEHRLKSNAHPFEQSILRRLLDTLPQCELGDSREQLLLEILQAAQQRSGTEGKRVVFCSSSRTCQRLSDSLSRTFGESSTACVCAGGDAESWLNSIERFRDDPECFILVGDTTMEEGCNLQFADALVMYDLPWSPMQIEQRIGRLDRIDRVEGVGIKVILTLDDPSLAPDSAWYTVLREGFGVYASSLSDLQFVIDAEMPCLKALAFEGGPQALAAVASSVRARIEEERKRLSEQDVLDGLRLGYAESSPLWLGLERSELRSPDLIRLLCGYLRHSLRLWATASPDASEIRYALHEGKAPLIPYERMGPISRYASVQFTGSRQRAIRNAELELLRPGHPVVEAIGQFLMSDHRGRAYAMWRRARGIHEPELVFRVCIVVDVDLHEAEDTDLLSQLDLLSRQAILRAARGWFTSEIWELYVDSHGNSASAELSRLCSQPYDRDFDTSLAGERSFVLHDLYGSAWRDLCTRAGARCCDIVRHSDRVRSVIAEARQAATLHFEQLTNRLRARSSAVVDPSRHNTTVGHALSQLRRLVDESLSRPRIEIDTLGAYVLSEESVCQR